MQGRAVRKHWPMVIACLSLMAGFAVAHFVALPVVPVACLTAVLALAVMLLSCGASLERVRGPALVLLLVAFAAWYYTYRYRYFPPGHVEHLAREEGTRVRVQGVVVDDPVVRKVRRRFETEHDRRKPAAVRASFTMELQPGARDSVTDAIGKVRVTLYDSRPGWLQFGAVVSVAGRLRKPSGPRNPGQFDYRTYLHRDGIRAVLSVGRATDIVPARRTQPASGVATRARTLARVLLLPVYRVRSFMARKIQAGLAGESRAVLKALLLGKRDELSAEVVENWQRSGAMHFLAISGLHVGIITMFAWALICFFSSHRMTTGLVVLLVVAAYVLLTVWRPPIFRAALMATVFLVGAMFRRQHEVINTIALAALIILVWKPAEMFGAGFQLSFCAVLGIICLRERIHHIVIARRSLVEAVAAREHLGRGRRMWYWLKNWSWYWIAVSLAAWIGILPLAAYYFNYVSFMVPLIGVVLFPFVCLSLVLGLGFLVVSCFSSLFGSIVAAVLTVVLCPMRAIVSTAAALPGSHCYVSSPHPGWIVIYYVLIMFFLLRPRFRLSLRHFWVIAVLFVNAFLASRLLRAAPEALRVTALDVQHGTAIFVEFPNGKNLLYDAGTMGTYEVGERTVCPYLWRRGIGKIDVVVVSHGHGDHLGGIPAICERFKVGRVLLGEPFGGTSTGKVFLHELAQLDLKPERIAAGDRVRGFGEASVEVLHPSSEKSLTPRLSENDQSVVLKITSRGKGLLLCGDIETGAMALLLSRPGELSADVAQLPHHGSWIPGGPSFAEAAEPSYGIISAKGGRPSQQTLADYRAIGTQLYSTAEGGALFFDFAEPGLRASTWRPGRDYKP